jgi:hypothetical protein
MADSASTSGVTADGLKEKLSTQLGAQFVEIEDMSGTIYLLFGAIPKGIIDKLIHYDV